MPDESDFRNYKTMEEFSKTVEGVKYLHDLYLKAVNHPIRREILEILSERKMIAREELFQKLLEDNIISDESMFNYNIDFLIKAFCLNQIEKVDSIYYEITQSGKVVDYLDK
jgi:DNA-binding transcriptional ArsR family regulator